MWLTSAPGRRPQIRIRKLWTDRDTVAVNVRRLTGNLLICPSIDLLSQRRRQLWCVYQELEGQIAVPQCCTAPITNIITQSPFASEDLLQLCLWLLSVHTDPPHICCHPSLSAWLFLFVKFPCLQFFFAQDWIFWERKVSKQDLMSDIHSAQWASSVPRTTLKTFFVYYSLAHILQTLTGLYTWRWWCFKMCVQ